MQSGVERAESPGVRLQHVLYPAMDVVASGLKTVARLGECLSRVVAKHGGAESGHTVVAASKLAGGSGFKPAGKLVQALGVAVLQG